MDEISLAESIRFVVDNRGKTVPTESSGIDLIATNCISNSQLYPARKNLRFISEQTYKTWFRSHPIPNDIILTNKGSKNGAICMVPDPVDFCIAQDMVALRADETKIDPKYLFAALRSKLVQSRIKSLNVDSVIPHLKKTDFNKLMIPLPARVIQSFIGSLYYKISQKIENNQRMNDTLEEMARAIFKSWFVDFDPVHAKAAGSAPAHMGADTAALFPSSFGDDGFPAGWKKQDIGLLVEVRKGLSYKGKFLSDGGVGMINLGCFGFRGAFKPEKIKSYTGEFIDRHKVKAGDLIFANTDMTQDRAILCSPIIVPSYIDESETIFSHHVSHVHFLEVQHPAFTELLRHFMMTPDFRMRAEGYATGTTVLAVPKNIFDGYHISVPSNEILTVFFEFISVIARKLEANYTENITLAELRDILLPKLMSGEIRVADAKREVEAL